MIDTKIILALDPERSVRLAQHRFRQTPSHLIVINDGDVRVDLHLNSKQLHDLYDDIKFIGGVHTP